jgi:hypothetical protein
VSRYDYSQLSDVEFEDLVADLMRAETGDRYERFARGPDGGIDLRHLAPGERPDIVQCKHYVRSSFSQLEGSLHVESERVQKIGPRRYYVATTHPLTPRQKDRLFAMFRPFMLSAGDVLGPDDIDNMLTAHPAVERAHVKLWLTNATTLEKLLRAQTENRTAMLATQIRRSLPLYVESSAFLTAQTMLYDKSICVIVGEPGIGKTVLARMLLLDAMGKDYQPVDVSEDIDEAWSVLAAGELQVFYYDDFLGMADFREKLGKNEDHRLANFIERVSGDKSKLLVMTTRAYVLAQALRIYERLQVVDKPVRKYVLLLDAYSRLDRAKILYNHLFHSALPAARRLVFNDARAYLRIIDHANYSPRLIEAIVEAASEARSDDDIVKNAIDALDRPERIWGKAFAGHLDDVQRAVLLTLVTFSASATMQGLASAIETYCRTQAVVIGPGGFEGALKVLETTFITIDAVTPRGRLVRFRNPSIRDFVIDYLNNNPVELSPLVRSSFTFEQAQRLWLIASSVTEKAGVEGGLSQALRQMGVEYVDLLRSLLIKPGLSHAQADGPTEIPASVLRESRLAFLLSIASDERFSSGRDWLVSEVAKVVDAWSRGDGQSEKFGLLIEAAQKADYLPKALVADLIAAAKRLLQGQIGSAESWRRLVDFHEDWADLFSEDEWSTTQSEFGAFLTDELAQWPYPDDLGTLEHCADALGFALPDEFEEAKEREAHDRSEAETRAEDEWRDRGPTFEPRHEASDDEIEAMFDRLADHA